MLGRCATGEKSAYWNILTPWSRVLPEKLTASQPVKKSPKIYYSVYRRPPPVPILIQINNGKCIGRKIHVTVVLEHPRRTPWF
jgi:hypothetical protein